MRLARYERWVYVKSVVLGYRCVARGGNITFIHIGIKMVMFELLETLLLSILSFLLRCSKKRNLSDLVRLQASTMLPGYKLHNISQCGDF